jgi:tetratricopeptide (TPR) repeat protein
MSSPLATTLTLLVLLGLAALTYAAWPLRYRRGEAKESDDDERTALEAEKLAALRALRELEADREAGHLLEADHAEMLERSEARAAAVLRRLDELTPRPVHPAPAVPPAGPPRALIPWSRQPAVLGGAGVAVLLFGVVLGVLVTRYTTPAPVEGPPAGLAAPGPVALGEAPGGQGAARALPPEMLQGMLQAARASLEAERYPEAIAAYKAVLKREPRNVDAITHLGVILAIAGHAEDALEAFDHALQIDADYGEALWYKASVLADAKQDDAGAIAAWERFVRVAAPGPDREQAVARIREAKARLGDARAARPGGHPGASLDGAGSQPAAPARP